MQLPQFRAVLPWLIGVSIAACVACLALAIELGLLAQTDARDRAMRQMSGLADTLARRLDADMAQYDVTLREASRLLPLPGQPPPVVRLLDLPLTARYAGFINVLNEAGDVVADPRSNVSRPAKNFAGRDYFQDQKKNAADTLMIGRPFAVIPGQQASIPLSRRLSNVDGGFAGVVVVGVHLSWLADLLTDPFSGPHPTITLRRDDGVLLMRSPFDADDIGRGALPDPAWQAWQRDGASAHAEGSDGIRMFRRLSGSPMVLELTVENGVIAAGERSWLIWLLMLTLVPGIGVLGLSLVARRLSRRGDQIAIRAAADADERTRLLATMSHELRTPLSGVLGQAELLALEGGLTPGQARRLDRMREAGGIMRDNLNRITNVARPDGGVRTPAQAPCDLDALVATCLGMVETEAASKGLSLTSTIAPPVPMQAMLVREHVQEALVNLLKNAVKFTAHGSVTSRVTGDLNHLRFEVADTGPGIPPAKLSRLFQEYDRLDISANRVEGTGLGLAITKRLVTGMGGRLGHVNNPGGGSAFWFEVPITVPEASLAMQGAFLPTTAQAPPPPAPEIPSLSLLLVDDIELTRAVTADFLRSGGHTVKEVADGETAIALIAEHDFDMVLTDMRMPVMNGLELTRRIRALPGYRRQTPVVLVTADLIAFAEVESGETGVNVRVIKPFTRGELLAAVAKAAGLVTEPDSVAGPAAAAEPSDGKTVPARQLSTAGDAGTRSGGAEARRQAGPADEPEPARASDGAARSADDPVLDMAALADLKRRFGDATFATQIDATTQRIADLLALLERPTPDDSTLRDAVHDLVGISGLLGLSALSRKLRWFDTAPDRAAPAIALREAATETLRALGQYHQQASADR